jgi:hypothetical protein
MATTYKVLGQTSPSANTETALYSPSGASSVVSTIVVCNQAGSPATYRIAVRKNGDATTGAANWIVYGASVAANDSTFLTLGVTLESGASLRVYSSSGTLSFSAFGSEIA